MTELWSEGSMGLLDRSRYLVGTGSGTNLTSFRFFPVKEGGESVEELSSADGGDAGASLSDRPRLLERDFRLTVEVTTDVGDSQNLTWYEMTKVW